MISADQMKRPWLGLMLLAAFATGGCSHPAPAESQAAQAPVVDTVPQRRDADDTARFLAGMPGKPVARTRRWNLIPPGSSIEKCWIRLGRYRNLPHRRPGGVSETGTGGGADQRRSGLLSLRRPRRSDAAAMLPPAAPLM